MHPSLTIATRAARKAGSSIVRALSHVDSLNVTEKSANDFVTEVDQRAEQEIIQAIRKSFPDHGILAEESGSHDGKDEYQWIIDPLDGTTNFLHGMPHFSISIALTHRGRLEAGLVFDPVKDEMFVASRGSGAMLNDRRIRVSKRKSLKGALLGTGFPFREEQDLDLYLKTFKAMVPGTAGIRRPGSAALDLAYVAAGRFDGFWEFDLNPWDMAAGIILIREAGGLVTDFGGETNYMKSGNVVASNLKLQSVMLDRLKSVLPESAQR